MKDLQILNQTLYRMRTDKYDWDSFVARVVLWNKIACNGVHDFSDNKILNQKERVAEEFNEVLLALEEGNKKQVIVELIDLVYVSSYLDFLCCNKEEDTIMENTMIFNNNLDKEVASLVRLSEVVAFVANSSEYNDMAFGAYHTCRTAVKLLQSLAVDIYPIAEGIMKANFTKFPLKTVFAAGKDFEESVATQIRMLEADGRYTGVTHTVVIHEGNEYVVFKDDKQKILKPWTFVAYAD